MNPNNTTNLFRIILLFLLVGFAGQVRGQTCTGCTHTIPNGGGSINVGASDVYCLPTGSTFTGTLSGLAAGGIICIAPEASFMPSNNNTSPFAGTIINRGYMQFTRYDAHTPTIINYGDIVTTGWQGLQGTLENRGTVNMNGYVSFSSASFINSYGILNVNNGGDFNGTIDNSGEMAFYGINLNGVLNNYGQMKFYNSLNVGENTYITNDDLLEMINIAAVQFNGPMLTNNGQLTISHNTGGTFNMNQSINQVYNNGIIIVSGEFDQNAAGSLLVNNCRIVAEQDFKIQHGTVHNNGFIWTKSNFHNSGTSSSITNGVNGYVRGVNFTSSGQVSGRGRFYFTGVTTNSNALFNGSSASDPILFFDASPTNGEIFDNLVSSNPWNAPTNTIRPLSMPVLDAADFDCSVIPPSVAGYPPTTLPFNEVDCTPPKTVEFPLASNVSAHPPVNGNPFTVLYSTIRLFEQGNASNPTNNTTNLVIPGTGVFYADTSTGVITFTPDPAFTVGTVTAEYRISNSWNGTPPIHPSGRTAITITFNDCDSAPRGIITNPMLIKRVRKSE